MEIRPTKLRLSCRSLEWLGDTDIAQFQLLFNTIGEYAVIQLQALTTAEQIQLLTELNTANPELFLDTANNKGLETLIQNPQTLTMLQEVVRAKNSWPATKQDLYERATAMLIKEHNAAKLNTLRIPTPFSLDELMTCAGILCATQIIGDAQGISLAPSPPDKDTLSVQSFLELISKPEIIISVLQSRLFNFFYYNESMCIHRTIAEFLAAKWLAEQVENHGLPLSRVMNLICVENKPALEMRGVFAWLTQYLKIDYLELINADPIAVLGGGDLAGLNSCARKALITALKIQSSRLPLVDVVTHKITSLGALATTETAELIREIIKDKTQPSLRTLLLESIASAPSLSELKNDLENIVLDETESFLVRRRAIDALLKTQHPNTQPTASLVGNTLKNSGDDLRLSAYIISLTYAEHFGPNDVITLFNHYRVDDAEHMTGELWFLNQAVPCADIPEILDAITAEIGKHSYEKMNDVLSLSISWIVLLLRENQFNDVPRLWCWLKALASEPNATYFVEPRALTDVWKKDKRLAKSLIVHSFSEFKGGSWAIHFDCFKNSVFDSINIAMYIPTLFKICKNTVETATKTLAYETLLNLTIKQGRDENDWLNQLCELADDSLDFLMLYQQYDHSDLETDWRRMDSLSKADSEQKASNEKIKLFKAFDDNSVSILTGEQSKLLAYSAEIYLDIHSNTNKSTSRHQRLVTEFTNERAEIAAAGFKASAHNSKNVPPVEYFLAFPITGRFDQSWYILLAGVDITWQQDQSLETLPDETIRAALMIDTYLHIYDSGNGSNVLAQATHSWATAICTTYPDLAFATLARCAENEVKIKCDHPQALNRLIKEFEQSPSIGTFCLDLLGKYSATSLPALKVLMRPISSQDNLQPQLREIIRANSSDSTKNSIVHQDFWLSYDFLVNDNDCENWELRINSHQDSLSQLWSLRNTIAQYKSPQNNKGLNALTSVQITTLARLFGIKFQPAKPPYAWCGNETPFDGWRYTLSLINELSTRTDQQAIAGLEGLLQIPQLSDYYEDIRLKQALQSVLKRQRLYTPPTWQQTLSVLKNGSPINQKDLQELILDHLRSLQKQIQSSNVDIYKQFWNEASHTKIISPKLEESARDVLVQLLRPRIAQHNIRAEPEVHMVKDKRADIVISTATLKVPLELKRDIHNDVWTACVSQLKTLYAIAPEANGFGIYLVFWYGGNRAKKLKNPPKEYTTPSSALEMQNILIDLVPSADREKLKIFVLDVSGS